MSEHIRICRGFCNELKKRFELRGRLQEEHLKQPVSELLKNFAGLDGRNLNTSPEEHCSEYKVRPDISVYVGKLICGHVELKNPHTSVDARGFRGRNLEQWKRLSNLPNTLYTNGQEWALYRSGEREGEIVRFPKNPSMDGGDAVDAESARKLAQCLITFLQWKPNTPHEPSRLAEHLARLTRILRGEAEAALEQEDSNVLLLREDLREFSSLSPAVMSELDVADVIAQTVTYSLLWARLEGAENLSPSEAAKYLHKKNEVLKALLELFAKAEDEMNTGFRLLRRSLEALDVEKFSKTSEMDVYFYEHFLRAYDPKLSKDAGIYYTPKEVVALQARLTSGILEEHFHKAEGFASEGVVLLDPAVGTGAYLIEAFRQGMASIEKRYGKAQVPASAKQMMENMYGIERLVGPYIVSHVQLSKAFREYQSGTKSDDIKPKVYLGDTLSSPRKSRHLATLLYEELTKERENLRKLKTEGEILVCIGNPPYDRQNIEQDDRNKYRKGGWVRYGDDIQGEEKSDKQGERAILEAFLKPARDAGKGGYLANLYNDYVYFWRWALWRLFEQQKGGGIISFITASSYLRGPSFVGMREVMRKTFDELWILDLEGDSLGTRKSANIFNIRTPVAIAIGYRGKKPQPTKAARVRYVKIPGETRREKLQALTKIERLNEDKVFAGKKQKKFGRSHSPLALEWRDCPQDWQAPFMPPSTGAFFDWPTLADLFPWHHAGTKFHRTWPIGETKEVLERRWRRLVSAPVAERAALFRETGDRKITYTSNLEIPGGSELSIKELGNDSFPLILPFSFRCFDNQYALVDIRLCDRLRPPLWHSLSDKQVFFSTLTSFPLDKGAAINATPHLPDICHFRGSYGGKDIFPLYRDGDTKSPNITRGLLEFLTEQYETDITAEDLFAYVYAILGGQSYTRIFWDELENPGAHVPIAKDAQLFKKASERGKEIIWLHTYAQRFRNKQQNRNGKVPKGVAKVLAAITEYPNEFSYNHESKELHIGDGRIAPIESEVWSYEISGLKVLQSWLGYRMKKPKGRKSSKLDEIRPQHWSPDMTTTLISLVWILEATINMEPDLEGILQSVIKSECFRASELPKPSEAQKAPPKHSIEAIPSLNIDGETQGH